ncbi:flavin reductase family protein [Mycolicibacterium goodii]|uniref:flavin reductase family protein n=1 Tax=Mycolicibacterium goodii TaxID=134601 RepID=UPI000C2593F1|nr:flavin reductase family protein [Mycolicibacterium goodii]PJK18859.1 oxidoreductase [Mycolicibacterium goodii]
MSDNVGTVTDLPQDDVRAFHRKFVTGITVVTTMAAGTPYGLALNAFASVSVDPATILVCVATSSSTHDVLVRTSRFAVNLLAHDQLSVAQRFATKSSDKFADIEWFTGEFGSPVLAGSCAHLEAETVEKIPASTHTVFFGRVLRAASTDTAPLVYSESAFFDGSALTPARP